MPFADTPTLGLLLVTPLVLLVVLACFGVALFTWSDGDTGVAIGAALTGLVVFGGLVIGMWPLKHDYHFWVPVSGKVEQTGKRLVSNGDKGMQERYVVTVDGRPYGIDDTRASLLRKGDAVSLKCKKDYEWGTPSSAHGWACRWNG